MGVRGWICAALVVLAPVGAGAAEWSSAGRGNNQLYAFEVG